MKYMNISTIEKSSKTFIEGLIIHICWRLVIKKWTLNARVSRLTGLYSIALVHASNNIFYCASESNLIKLETSRRYFTTTDQSVQVLYPPKNCQSLFNFAKMGSNFWPIWSHWQQHFHKVVEHNISLSFPSYVDAHQSSRHTTPHTTPTTTVATTTTEAAATTTTISAHIGGIISNNNNNISIHSWHY